MGDNGSGLTLDNGVTVPQGQVYINTAISVTNNSGLTPVQNSASNTMLSQCGQCLLMQITPLHSVSLITRELIQMLVKVQA